MQPPEDHLNKLEVLLSSLQTETAKKVEIWQTAHQKLSLAHKLVHDLNLERKTITPNSELKSYDSLFSSLSGVSFVHLAEEMKPMSSGIELMAAGNLLLGGLQSNIASYLSGAPLAPQAIFPATLSTLKSSETPLESRVASLAKRLSSFPEHYQTMVRGVAADLLNTTNPVHLSNAAKNLRETMTSLVHALSPDSEISKWPDVEIVDKRPTRRSRLEYYIFGSPSDLLE